MATFTDSNIFQGTTDFDGAVTVGGTITVDGTAEFNAAVTFTDAITIPDDSIDSAQIAAGAIDLAHMSANSVDSDQYVDGSIDGAHIANDAIDSQHYAAGSIDNEHLADDAVNSDEIADGAVDPVHLASGYRTVAEDAAVVIAATDRHINLLSSTTGDKAATMTATHAGHRIDIVLTAASGGSYTFAVTGGDLTFNAAGEGGAIVYNGSAWIYASPLTAATLV